MHRNTKRIKWILVLGECVLLAAFAAWYLWPTAEVVVRSVEFKGRAPTGLGPGGPSERSIARFESPSELSVVYPEPGVAPPDGVDWQRESLLRVRWHAGGVIPLDESPENRETVHDTLTWRARKRGRLLVFDVSSPVRGGWFGTNVGAVFHRVWHEDWFAVPKSTAASFTAPFHVVKMDLAFLAGVFASACLILSTARAGEFRRRVRPTAATQPAA